MSLSLDYEKDLSLDILYRILMKLVMQRYKKACAKCLTIMQYIYMS